MSHNQIGMYGLTAESWSCNVVGAGGTGDLRPKVGTEKLRKTKLKETDTRERCEISTFKQRHKAQDNVRLYGNSASILGAIIASPSLYPAARSG